jgi:shikimate kinase
VTQPDGSADWIWRDQAIIDLLGGHSDGDLFVAGCKTNQGRFYPMFDHIVLLSAPAEVLLARIAARTDNPYGKLHEERQTIVHHLNTVEPLLRATATVEIDTTAPIENVVQQLEELTAH